eukprot:scaffold143036_cov35-Tisochrysis_lutea.AAC.1
MPSSSFAATEAPRRPSKRTTRKWPPTAAACKAVPPFLERASALAPASSSISAIFACPSPAA